MYEKNFEENLFDSYLNTHRTMGLFFSYLGKPITDKESQDESNDKLICGASSMQGWRLDQEDAHNCILDYDTNTSFFAVYDGHGGHEVSLYCSKYLPEFIKNTPEYKENKIEEALIEGFLRFDAEITKPEVIAILKEMVAEEQKRKKELKQDEDSDDEDEENVDNLYEEAAMPIEQVIEKYTSNLKTERKEKDSDATVGTSASCSGSLSRQTPDKCADGVSSSSEAESSTDKKIIEVNGPEEKPTVSNSSDTSHEAESSEQKNEEAPIQNGEVTTADSVSQAKSDVTSSSTSVENGTPSKKGKGKAVIKPEPVKTPNPRPKRNAKKLYEEWLNNHEDSEEESDEEEDQTFEGPNEESSEDENDGVNVAINASDESSEEGEEEEDDEEDDEGEEEEEEDEETAEHNLKFARNMEQLSGSGSDSGCTAVVAVLRDNELYVANAGDSRCIVCRNGKAVEMSFDHKPEDKPEYDRIVKAGGKVSRDGRVNGGLNLSRAIGDHAYKQNKELSDREQMITALPDIKKLTINPSEDEFMVLACDGIWNSMSSQEVVDFVKPRISDGREKLSTVCEEMFDHCLAPDTLADGAGCDNMTAIVIKFKSKLNKRAASPPSSEENNAKRAKTEDSETQVDTTV